MNYQNLVPRLLISAPQGRSGKTTITLGLLSALAHQGLKVQSFKKGPDFIDPSWHTKVTGRDCRNMDLYMFNEKTMFNSFVKNCQGVDISIIEGAMGLYDGVDLEGSGSTAQIAKSLNSPAILVIDARRMTRSAAAMVMGYQNFDKDINIAGVILNKVAGNRHEKMLRQSIEKYCSVPIIGVIPKNSGLEIPDRHLGLIPAEEDEKLHFVLENIRKVITEGIDLEKVIQIAKTAVPLKYSLKEENKDIKKRVKIGIIKDKAFSFYYPENLERLALSGGELVFIDSLNNNRLPEIDALFIGGGFPEIFAEKLQENISFQKDIKDFAENGAPIYAECGGLMYLSQSINIKDKKYKMTGVLPLEIELTEKPQGHGYTRMQVVRDNPFLTVNSIIKGHEFHNSHIINMDSEVKLAFKVEKGKGANGQYDGIIYKNVLASYNHIHALGVPEWADNFIKAAQNKGSQES